MTCCRSVKKERKQTRCHEATALPNFSGANVRCPGCGSDQTRVIDSRLSDGGDTVRRRRACQGCEHRFTTFERSALDHPRVIKSDGRRELWNEEKLRRGIMRALEKRPVGVDEIETTVLSITRLQKLSGEREISSSLIGQVVMDALQKLDEVAYVRYASVYRRFEDASAFTDEVDRLERSRQHAPEVAQLSLLADPEMAPKK